TKTPNLDPATNSTCKFTHANRLAEALDITLDELCVSAGRSTPRTPTDLPRNFHSAAMRASAVFDKQDGAV
ncbi:hypothetical protein, partial [Rhizobium sp. 12,4]|uniref:hypothetical protein n=1 Tax=Rhizobium sp. 12,4 TaxID=3405135 RepID=UPI003D32C131